MTDPTLRDLTDRLAELLDDRPTAEHALHDAMRNIPIAHEPRQWNYDYARLLDLVERIRNCAHKIDLSDRTIESNGVALALASQIAADAREVQDILRARQTSIAEEAA